MELAQLWLVLAADVQQDDDQRARDRPRRVRVQHRQGGDEQAHERPGGRARRRAGDIEPGRRERVWLVK